MPCIKKIILLDFNNTCLCCVQQRFGLKKPLAVFK